MQHRGVMSAAHTHPDIEVNFLLSGSFSYLHGGSVVTIEAGRFTVLWGGVPHQTLPPGIVDPGIWITLPLGWCLQWRLPNAFSDRLLRGEIIAGPPDPGDRPLLERWLEDAAGRDPARQHVLQLEMEARFHRLALGMPDKPRASARHAGEAGAGQIARVTRFIAQHYREPLSVQAIAQEAKLHPKYLMRIFKKQSGAGIWEYLTRLRVSHAQRLLITTELKVLDVAMESGFSSMAPFYAAFAAHTRGLRPLDYRRQHRPHPTH
jgi:AraC-like DNA-binding protein